MRRFDALGPYKQGLAALGRDMMRDPLAAMCAAASLLRSMRWMLETAGLAHDGVEGVIAVKLTTAAYLSAMRVWQGDDSADLAPTMAALDARLRRIEPWLGPPRRYRSEVPDPLVS
jgi:hypothetical protein